MSKAAFKRMMRERAVRPQRGPASEATNGAEARQQYVAPSDEQLANFVACMVNAAAEADGLGARLDPLTAGLMLMANPEHKLGWLRRHREFQEAAWRSAP